MCYPVPSKLSVQILTDWIQTNIYGLIAGLREMCHPEVCPASNFYSSNSHGYICRNLFYKSLNRFRRVTLNLKIICARFWHTFCLSIRRIAVNQTVDFGLISFVARWKATCNMQVKRYSNTSFRMYDVHRLK